MSATDREALGASTLVRKWYLDVNTGTDKSPVWIGVFGIMEFAAPKEPTLQDDSDFYSAWKSQVVTALSWSIELKVARKVTVDDPTDYDPGQEALRLASDGTGTGNRVHVRWYEMTPDGPRVEAYEGYAAVTWTPDGGSMEAIETVTVTLSGQGKREAISHPAAAAGKPEIFSLTPYTGSADGGTLVQVRGKNFVGIVANGVKFGAAIADYTLINSGLLVATSPEQAGAGSQDVSVENAKGVSDVKKPFIYTAGS